MSNLPEETFRLDSQKESLSITWVEQEVMLMRKLKLYLDTSIISHLFADDTPEKMDDTNRLWEDFTDGKYRIYISQIVINEIERCPEPKRSRMLEKLRQTEFEILDETDEVNNLAVEYIGGVFKFILQKTVKRLPEESWGAKTSNISYR